MLSRAVRGRETGWCTAWTETARDQLLGGDTWVYFSLDLAGEPTIPRIIIKMQEGEIAQIRGVAKDQRLDQEISSSGVLERKLAEMGNQGPLFYKRLSDMKQLSEIFEKNQNGIALSRAELRFLYELDGKIDGFGDQMPGLPGRDSRIDEIKRTRDRSLDLIQANS